MGTCPLSARDCDVSTARKAQTAKVINTTENLQMSLFFLNEGFLTKDFKEA